MSPLADAVSLVHGHQAERLVGGQGAGNNIQSFNIETGDWELFPGDSRLVVDHMQAVSFQNEIWTMGGRTTITTQQVLIWNPVTREWREGPPMNHRRAGLAAKVIQGQIMVVGGGGRENAIAWRCHEEGHELIAAPGSDAIGGTSN